MAIDTQWAESSRISLVQRWRKAHPGEPTPKRIRSVLDWAAAEVEWQAKMDDRFRLLAHSCGVAYPDPGEVL